MSIQYIQLTVTIAEFFATAGIKNIFPRVKRVTAEIGFDDVALYFLDGDKTYQTRIVRIEAMEFFTV